MEILVVAVRRQLTSARIAARLTEDQVTVRGVRIVEGRRVARSVKVNLIGGQINVTLRCLNLRLCLANFLIGIDYAERELCSGDRS